MIPPSQCLGLGSDKVQIAAKSVLQRDLDQLRLKGNLPEAQQAFTQPDPSEREVKQENEPKPIESQTKSPMVIDLESSPAMEIKDEPQTTEQTQVSSSSIMDGAKEPKSSPSPDAKVKTEAPLASMSAATAVMAPNGGGLEADFSQGHNPGQSNGFERSGPAASEAIMSAADGNSGSELNFTNMTFSLAPPNEDAAISSNQPEPSFDLSNFNPGEGHAAEMVPPEGSVANKDSQLDSATEQSTQQPQATGESSADQGMDPLSEFDFNADGGTGDGLDFDFSLGDGANGENTFDDLMDVRDDDFSGMQHGDFDTAFFGLDKDEGL